MINAFAGMNGFETFFLLCAIIGSFFLVVRMVMQFVGADVDADADFDVDIDADHIDSDVGFKVLSLQSLTAFLMMFGLVGLALYRQNGVCFTGSMVGACLAGLAAVWVIGRLFAWFDRLQSSGTLRISQAIGCKGSVYLTIAAGGSGRVTIDFHNRLREFDAVAEHGGEIPTGTPVEVVKVNAQILVVKSLAE